MVSHNESDSKRVRLPDYKDMTNSGCCPGDVCMFVKCVRNVRVFVSQCEYTKDQSIIPASHKAAGLFRLKPYRMKAPCCSGLGLKLTSYPSPLKIYILFKPIE